MSILENAPHLLSQEKLQPLQKKNPQQANLIKKADIALCFYKSHDDADAKFSQYLTTPTSKSLSNQIQ